MMDNLRTAANSVVLKIIFGIIIVSFILTGVSGYLIGGNNNYAAKMRSPANAIVNSSSWAISFLNWLPMKTT